MSSPHRRGSKGWCGWMLNGRAPVFTRARRHVPQHIACISQGNSASSYAPSRFSLCAKASETSALTSSTLTSIQDVKKTEWDALVNQQNEVNPFLLWSFLHALEDSGSVAPSTGWTPQHLVVRDAEGTLVGACPLYIKSHSQGEYVFDSAWASLADMLDLEYYPKLQGCVPFTPVPGRRLLVASGATHSPQAIVQALGRALIALADALDVSSVHLTFLTAEEWAALEPLGFLQRTGLQFHWENRGYSSFDSFLADLRQSKRKAVRQERKSIVRQGLRTSRLSGHSDLNGAASLWDRVYDFYTETVDKNWGTAYLTRDFFHQLGEAMPDNVLLSVAYDDTPAPMIPMYDLGTLSITTASSPQVAACFALPPACSQPVALSHRTVPTTMLASGDVASITSNTAPNPTPALSRVEPTLLCEEDSGVDGPVVEDGQATDTQGMQSCGTPLAQALPSGVHTRHSDDAPSLTDGQHQGPGHSLHPHQQLPCSAALRSRSLRNTSTTNSADSYCDLDDDGPDQQQQQVPCWDLRVGEAPCSEAPCNKAPCNEAPYSQEPCNKILPSGFAQPAPDFISDRHPVSDASSPEERAPSPSQGPPQWLQVGSDQRDSLAHGAAGGSTRPVSWSLSPTWSPRLTPETYDPPLSQPHPGRSYAGVATKAPLPAAPGSAPSPELQAPALALSVLTDGRVRQVDAAQEPAAEGSAWGASSQAELCHAITAAGATGPELVIEAGELDVWRDLRQRHAAAWSSPSGISTVYAYSRTDATSTAGGGAECTSRSEAAQPMLSTSGRSRELAGQPQVSSTLSFDAHATDLGSGQTMQIRIDADVNPASILHQGTAAPPQLDLTSRYDSAAGPSLNGTVEALGFGEPLTLLGCDHVSSDSLTDSDSVGLSNPTTSLADYMADSTDLDSVSDSSTSSTFDMSTDSASNLSTTSATDASSDAASDSSRGDPRDAQLDAFLRKLLGLSHGSLGSLVRSRTRRYAGAGPVASALHLVGSHALYGRNWGCQPGREYKNLHFELCYYQALEEAISRGLPRVEAGAQGEHKLQRGYLPSLTYSSHYIRDPRLESVVRRMLVKERARMDFNLQVLTLTESPYKERITREILAHKISQHVGWAPSSSHMDSHLILPD